MQDNGEQEVESILPLLVSSRVVVCLGPGGVGKTTTAAALAVAGALAGRKVAVLTVDPAARLRDALELPPTPGQFHRVPLPGSPTGTLEAILLDAKGLFDGLVRRLAPSPELAERILDNQVYKNIAGAFAGSDAYMALEQLLDIVRDGRFDLVVVDTPPASHALELFDAPERILALLNSKALDYLEQPARILGVATSRLTRGLLGMVLAGLERLTGLRLLRDISALAADFAQVSTGFRARATAIQALQRAPDTHYVLVTAPQPHGAPDTLAFADEILRLGIPIDAVIVNRVLRLDRADDDAMAASLDLGKGLLATWPASLARKLVACARDIELQRDAERAVIAELVAGFAELDARHAEKEAAPAAASLVRRSWVELQALLPAPTDLVGIWRLARSLDL